MNERRWHPVFDTGFKNSLAAASSVHVRFKRGRAGGNHRFVGAVKKETETVF